MNIQEVTFADTNTVSLKTRELDTAELKPDQILLATEYSIVSAGTELSIWRGVESWAPLPAVPGYGAVGIVQRVGSGVTRCKAGERIFCYGGHRSFSILNETMILRVPDDLEPQRAVLARMGQVAFTSVRTSDAELGDTVAVLGLGLVGNLAAQLLKLAGCTVIGLDVSEKRLATARACGIDHVLNTRDVQPPALAADIRARTGGLCQTIVEATGIPAMAATAAQLAARNGEVILLGTPRGPFNGDATELLRSIHLVAPHVTFKGAHEWILPHYATPYMKHSLERNVTQFFGFLKSGKLHSQELISHLAPPTRCVEIYTNLRDRNEDYFGVIFDWRAIA